MGGETWEAPAPAQAPDDGGVGPVQRPGISWSHGETELGPRLRRWDMGRLGMRHRLMRRGSAKSG